MIRQLPTEVINQIAAGEVVERPSSVLKELIENSLDASSTEIRIYTKESGVSKIQVLDNGVGIAKDDLNNLFLKHSTSKITCIDDLLKIRTFGFRGEALASISSVSKVTLQTKHKDADLGWEISVEYGMRKNIQISNITSGTNVIVEDLFGNIPVRRKFLKSRETENKSNVDVINKFLLSNHTVSFYVSLEGNAKTYPSTSIASRINSVIKIDLSDLIEINYTSGYIQITGYIVHPKNFLKTKSYQYIFVNKRPVQDYIISKAMLGGFDTLLMKNQYPGYVIFVDLDPSEVDFNVHPRKIEVRFKNTNLVYREIHRAINSTLMRSVRVSTQRKFLSDIEYHNSSDQIRESQSVEKSKSSSQSNGDFKDFEKFLFEEESNSNCVPSKVTQKESITQKVMQFNEAIISSTPDDQCDDNGIKSDAESDNQKNDADINIFSEKKGAQIPATFKIDIENATQLLNSYIITSNEDSIIVVDQHAASERILYERYIRSIKARKIPSTPLLIPLVIELPFDQILLIEERKKLFQTLGFDYEFFGTDSVKITQVPDFVRMENFNKILGSIVAKIQELSIGDVDNEFISDKILGEIAASLACHSAIRFGDKLSKDEVKKIISDLMLCENPYNCPHGRPIIMEYSKFELEKQFKRCSI